MPYYRPDDWNRLLKVDRGNLMTLLEKKPPVSNVAPQRAPIEMRPFEGTREEFEERRFRATAKRKTVWDPNRGIFKPVMAVPGEQREVEPNWFEKIQQQSMQVSGSDVAQLAALPLMFGKGKVPKLSKATKVAKLNDYQKLVSALEPPKSRLVDRVTQAKDSLLRGFYDRNRPLKALEKDTGIPAHKLAQVVPGSTAAGEDILRVQWRPAWKSVEKDVKFLEQYMVLMRNQDILARNAKAKLPGGISGAQGTQRALDTLKAKIGDQRFKQIEQAADKLWRLNDETVLKPMLQEGLISQEGYAAIRQNNPRYIPFQRSDFTDNLQRVFSRPEADVKSTGIKRLALGGSERALDNPLARMEAQVIKAQNLIFRNRAARATAQALEQSGIAKKVKGKTEHSNITDTFSYFENGNKVTMQVPTLFANVAKGLEQETANVLSKVLKATSAPLRHGAVTYNPFFVPINAMRDSISALFREGLIPFSPTWWRGLQAAVTKNELFSQAARSGVMMSGIVDTMRSTDAMKRVQKLGGIKLSNPKDALLLVPRLIEQANLIGERGTRIAVFSKLKGKGLSDLEAAIGARDATVDFSKSGTVMQIINQVIPFSNAALQGTANMMRTIRDNPKRAAAVGALLGTGSLLSRINNMRFETSKLIPEYEYTGNWVIQVGEGTRKSGEKFPIYIKLPKGQLGAIATFPTEAAFNIAQKDDDRSAVEMIFDTAIEAAKTMSPIDPNVTGVLPPLLQTGVGVQTGVDPFSGIPIIPRSQENLLPEQQFTEKTSEVAVALGQKFKISPAKIDFVIKDSLAGGGQTLTWLSDLALRAIGYDPKTYKSGVGVDEATSIEKTTQTTPVGRFVGTKATQPEKVGWEQFRKSSVDTNREFAQLEGVQSLGIRLGEVGDSIFNQELTPQQQAQYQRLMANVVTNGMRDVLPRIKNLPTEVQRELLQSYMRRYKEVAKVEFYGNIRKSGK